MESKDKPKMMRYDTNRPSCSLAKSCRSDFPHRFLLSLCVKTAADATLTNERDKKVDNETDGAEDCVSVTCQKNLASV